MGSDGTVGAMMTTDPEPDAEYRLLSLREVGEHIAVSPRTLSRWIREGQLPAVRVGGQWRIARPTLDPWIGPGR